MYVSIREESKGWVKHGQTCLTSTISQSKVSK